MFTLTTEYALRAMTVLAQEPLVLMPTGVVAERTRVPANYLAKVLQQLASSGLVEGRRGLGGGYKLARPAKEISLLEVVRAVGRMERSTGVVAIEPGESLESLQRHMNEAASFVIERFGKVHLSDVVSEIKPMKEVPRAPST